MILIRSNIMSGDMDGLTAARQQKQAIKRRSKKIPLRYFTFCAKNAIDIFMLEREGILKRSEETGPMEGVYFCEKKERDFEKIEKLIGLPQRGFRGSFEDIVLFKDDEKTEGKKLEDELESDGYYTPDIREKLRYKETHHRLREAFPFDIINLDVSDVMFPTGKEMIGPLLESIIRILEWQQIQNFLSTSVSVSNSRYSLPPRLDRIVLMKRQFSNLKIGLMKISV